MIWVGTSGYNYPEWKGRFYPPTLPASKMLGYYAERFPTVEINYTFYRMPTEKLVQGWASGTPEPYRLTLKAPRRITHDRRLRDCGELVKAFCHAASALGPKLGILLFQLGPAFKADLPLFDAVYERLRARNLALCLADSDTRSTPIVPTANYGYFRLRDEGYTDADLDEWARVIREHEAGWEDTYVYFKHEDEGKGPELARQLMDRLGL